MPFPAEASFSAPTYRGVAGSPRYQRYKSSKRIPAAPPHDPRPATRDPRPTTHEGRNFRVAVQLCRRARLLEDASFISVVPPRFARLATHDPDASRGRRGRALPGRWGRPLEGV